MSELRTTDNFQIEIGAVDGGVLVLDVTIENDTLRPDDIWREKDEVLEDEKKSLEAWSKMSDDDRETKISIVQNALDRLIENSEEWVPASLDIAPGEYLQVRFRILFSDLESELRNAKVVTERRIAEAADGAVALSGEEFVKD